mmetsp:Transcript_68348/g.114865  ORF Transcript_68348/g.114865 Transcript_68348/m.114865 type:complete len:232 (+) Transcript_68348:373-1068(+)
MGCVWGGPRLHAVADFVSACCPLSRVWPEALVHAPLPGSISKPDTDRFGRALQLALQMQSIDGVLAGLAVIVLHNRLRLAVNLHHRHLRHLPVLTEEVMNVPLGYAHGHATDQQPQIVVAHALARLLLHDTPIFGHHLLIGLPGVQDAGVLPLLQLPNSLRLLGIFILWVHRQALPRPRLRAGVLLLEDYLELLPQPRDVLRLIPRLRGRPRQGLQLAMGLPPLHHPEQVL